MPQQPPLPASARSRSSSLSLQPHQKPRSRVLPTFLIVSIVLLCCANIVAVWALWGTVDSNDTAAAPGQVVSTATPHFLPLLPLPQVTLPPTPIATLVIPFTPTPRSTPTPQASPTPAPVETLPPSSTPRPAEPTETPAEPAAKKVIIISIDGLRPDALDQADAPTLHRLRARGAYSASAQTVKISETLPSHASMLGGMTPDKHGIVWGIPYIGWPGMNGPTLFSVAHEAGLSTAMVFGKDKLHYLILPASVDTVFGTDDVPDVEIKNQAIKIIQAGLPDVLFIHFPDIDRVGHLFGWMSPNQLYAITFTDSLIAEIMAVLETSGHLNSTLLIITADHGGHGRFHGDDSPEDRTIPWLAVGPGVPQGLTLSSVINTYDTAATALYFLGLPIPQAWDGRPVMEIFK